MWKADQLSKLSEAGLIGDGKRPGNKRFFFLVLFPLAHKVITANFFFHIMLGRSLSRK